MIIGIDEGRRESPFLTKAQWHCALQRNSFTGVEIAVNDTEGPAQVSTMMLSKATTPGRKSSFPRVNIIIEESQIATDISEFGAAISEELLKRDLEVSLNSWELDNFHKEEVYLILDNGNQPLLVDPTPAKFGKIQSLTKEASRVLWVSVQQETSAAINPEKALVTGLARTAHAENEDLTFITLDIQQSLVDEPTQLVRTITDLLLRSFEGSSESKSPIEREYVYRNNQLLIPRIIPDDGINQWISRSLGKFSTRLKIYGEKQRPLKLMLDNSKLSTNAIFTNDETDNTKLHPSDIEIEIKAHGVNRRDALAVLGGDRSCADIVGECAGVVTKVGSDVHDLHEGDRVCAWGTTPYATRSRAHESQAFQLPDPVDFAFGASIPFAFMTAYNGLHGLAHLQPGQTVLIHSATSAIGQAALFLAREIGAQVVATISSGAQCDELVDNLGLSTDEVVRIDFVNAADRIIQATGGEGVHVVLDCSTLEPISKVSEWIVPFGTYVRLGEVETSDFQMPVVPSSKNVTCFAFDMVSWSRRFPIEAAAFFKNATAALKRVRTLPKHRITRMNVAEIKEAFRKSRDGTLMGKLVLEVGEGSLVETVDTSRPSTALDKNGTYILSGGFGDVGRRVCRLMVRRGARNLVVLSRGGFGNARFRKLENELLAMSAECKIYNRLCDITDPVQVDRVALDLVNMGLPPVRGVIQAAVTLRVSIY